MTPIRPRGFFSYYGSAEGLRFLTRHSLALGGTAVALLAVFSVGDVDRAITRWFFDTASGTFPLANDWWLKTVLHDAARDAAASGALALLMLTAAAWLLPRGWRAGTLRDELAFASAAALGAAVAVVALKHSSMHDCPWDIIEFGGRAPYRRLLAAHGESSPLGGCFPAAHPLVGYAWLSLGFALYPGARRLAIWCFSAALCAGTVFGAVQVIRGAHFTSHVLSTAWAVWAIDVALLAACCAVSRARKPSACLPGASRSRA